MRYETGIERYFYIEWDYKSNYATSFRLNKPEREALLKYSTAMARTTVSDILEAYREYKGAYGES